MTMDQTLAVLEAEQWRRQLAYLASPRCRRCKVPTPKEHVHDAWYEAGEWVCDDCGRDTEATRARAHKGPRER